MKPNLIILLIISIIYNEIRAQRPTISIEQLFEQVFNNETSTTTNNNNGQNTIITTAGPPPIKVTTDSSTSTDNLVEYQPTYDPCGDNNICVPFYQCTENGTFNVQGENLIDIRFDDTKPCTSYLEVCCNTDVKSLDQSIREPDPIENIVNECGKRNLNGVVFKLKGNKDNEAEYAEFPWMIALLKVETVDKEILHIYICGGSLIHPRVVLSGAHCVEKYDANNLIVRAGEWDTQTKEEIYKDQDRKVIEIVLHEEFSKGGLLNDIALLFTSEPFILQKHINTVCLPPLNTNFDNNRCFVTGWGKDEFGQKGKYQVIMKKIDLPIVPFDTCEKKLRESRLGKFFQLHKSFICAGGELGKDACKGDGGGPLICPIPGQGVRYYQAGIVAWGIGCDGSYPGVYASISYLREWVDNVLTMRNFDSVYYTAL